MLSLFDQLQKGLLSPTSFVYSHTTRRVFNLELSRHVTVEESDFNGGINTLDIEQVEQRYLLSANNDNSVFIHDLYNSTGCPIYTCKVVGEADRSVSFSHKYCVQAVHWYPIDTGMFTSSALDGKMKIWDTNRMVAVVTLTMRQRIYTHHLSPIATNHTLIATAQSYPHVVLADMRTGSSCHELYGHTGHVVSVRWSPVCEYLLASGGNDNKIFFWDIRSASSCLKTLDQHNGEDSKSSQHQRSAHSGKVNGLCFSPDGLYLISFGSDNKVRLWDVAKVQNTLVNYGTVLNKHYGFIQTDMCYNSAIPTIFVPSGNKVLVFDMFRGSKLAELSAHFGYVRGCMFRSRYHDLYSIGTDKNIHVWTSDNQPELYPEIKASKDNWDD